MNSNLKKYTLQANSKKEYIDPSKCSHTWERVITFGIPGSYLKCYKCGILQNINNICNNLMVTVS